MPTPLKSCATPASWRDAARPRVTYVTVKFRFSLGIPLNVAYGQPKGSRAASGAVVYGAVRSWATLPPGHISAGSGVSRVTYVDSMSPVRNFRHCGPLLTTMSDILRSKHNEHDDHRDNDQPYQS